MKRKEIFFKKLSFIIGVILMVSFVMGKEMSLPLQSEVISFIGKFHFRATKFIIRQVENNVKINLFSNLETEYWYDWGGIIRVGIVPIEDYKNFWNSLYALKFWELKDRYRPNYITTDLPHSYSSYISVSYKNKENDSINKRIEFKAPKACAKEFKKVYELFQDMKRFAKDPPELNELLKNSEEWGENFITSEISRIKNPIYLDTLLNLLSPENIYAYGIIQALGNIGDKRAVPALYQFLENLNMLPKSKFPPYLPRYRSFRSYQNLVIATFSSLAAIRDTQSIQLLKDYLNDKYDYWIRGQASIQLAWIKDYSGIPMLIDYLNHSRYCDSGKIFIRRIYDKNKEVVSVIIENLSKELEKEGINDRKIISILNILTDLTGQNYPYSQHFLFEDKKETVDKWISWWEANKDTLK